jgi:hypothetical protein
MGTAPADSGSGRHVEERLESGAHGSFLGTFLGVLGRGLQAGFGG